MAPTSETSFATLATEFQPWLNKSEEQLAEQRSHQALLAKRAGATFGKDAYVSPGAHVFTQSFALGDNSWVASGAIIRDKVSIGSHSTVNAYAHIAGKVTVGNSVRIAAHVSIMGFNHGTDRTDVPIYQQALTSVGIVVHDDVWVGANAVILDGVEIGAHCIVAAGAVVTKSVPPWQIVGGNPARVIRDRRLPAEAATAPAPPEASAAPRGRVSAALYDTDPYAHLERSYPTDLQGWGSQEPIFRQTIEALNPALICEVGTWKGASAIHMADICKQLGVKAEIVCIDTWLGNWQHWNRVDGIGSKQDLKLVNGFPTLYYQFLSNVIARKHQDIITPFPLPSVAAVKWFQNAGIKPNLVYIDGDHEYESVNVDLKLWSAVLAPGGQIIGDDFNWPGVKRAVEEMVAAGGWGLTVAGNKFHLKRT